MGLKERIENNLVIWFLGALLTGFLSGVGTYEAVLRIAHLDVVPANSYLKKEMLRDNKLLIQKLHTLINDGRNIQEKNGDDLISSFNMWMQKGMLVTKAIDEETHRLFNNNVYFSNMHVEQPSQVQIEKDTKERIKQGVAILEGAIIILETTR